MKNLRIGILIFLFAGINGWLTAQPQYYNYNTSGNANSYPFGIASGKEVQLLYLAGEFNQPSPAPAGAIGSISFMINISYPLGPWTYTDLTIKMGQTTITSFDVGALYTGSLTTVYYRASVSLTGLAGQWMTIDLDTPFPYDPSQSLIIDVGQCAAPAATGFSMCFTNLTGNRRIWSASGCPFTYGGINSSLYHMGISMCNTVPVPTINGTNDLCVNSGTYAYVTEPGMTNYTWAVSAGGTINGGAGTDQITVAWIAPGAQTVSVNYTNECLLQAPSPTVFNVNVNNVPAAAGSITGTATVCAGAAGVAYSVATVPGAVSYIWNLTPGATIASGEWTPSITVDFPSYATSGNITVAGNNLCGNGPVSPGYYVTVKPMPPTPVIMYNGSYLASSSADGNQWYLEGVAIPGATGQNHTPTHSGKYTCIVTLDGCSSLVSNEITVVIIGISETGVGTDVSIYPNPGDGLFTLEIRSARQETFTIQVYNNLGSMIREFNGIEAKGIFEKTIDLRSAANGIYTFVIRSSSARIVKKVQLNH